MEVPVFVVPLGETTSSPPPEVLKTAPTATVRFVLYERVPVDHNGDPLVPTPIFVAPTLADALLFMFSERGDALEIDDIATDTHFIFEKVRDPDPRVVFRYQIMDVAESDPGDD